ncbi:hypothetical protein FDP41_013387 [Naegleria fowleri]|uniref:F-actin-capping protein subunit alpha n=1 Tax=Naegleria fowleri TaxID=5763 RepID=A0A6A5BQ53_NAEFO|nr:uncharacterized protein FDP41_013387 [Naegleria fowleri]KAF0980173.1 hypothetical protein FDP41_013387 [Naegleria fowleri]CAG4716127.1 unnamed protein product [Naegleria fowleri]
MSQLSPDETLRIVRHFLLSSPPGQFEDVLYDIRELVANDQLLNTGAFDIFRTYNVEQLIPVEVPNQTYKVILSKYNEITPQTYLDPVSDQVLTVDHVKGQVTGVSPASSDILNNSLKQKKDKLVKAIQKYVDDHYLSGISSVFPSQRDDQKGELIICITASKFNDKNFWSGRWRSVYRVSFADDKVKVSGSMKVNCHYYENGNVQLNTSKEHAETVDGGDSFADNIVKMLVKAEGNFQTQIDTSCANLNETFKSLRRPLPMTKTLFDFASSQHKLAREFGGN